MHFVAARRRTGAPLRHAAAAAAATDVRRRRRRRGGSPGSLPAADDQVIRKYDVPNADQSTCASSELRADPLRDERVFDQIYHD